MGELVAAADPNQELRDKAKEQFGCPQVFESYEELLQNVEVDAVYIYSDHVTSADLAVMAEECQTGHGMNVLSVAGQGGTNTTQNVVSMLFKALYPGQIWAFGALQYSLPGDPQDHPGVERPRRS